MNMNMNPNNDPTIRPVQSEARGGKPAESSPSDSPLKDFSASSALRSGASSEISTSLGVERSAHTESLQPGDKPASPLSPEEQRSLLSRLYKNYATMLGTVTALGGLLSLSAGNAYPMVWPACLGAWWTLGVWATRKDILAGKNP